MKKSKSEFHPNHLYALSDDGGVVCDPRVYLRESDARDALKVHRAATRLLVLRLQFPAQLMRSEEERRAESENRPGAGGVQQ